MKTQEFWQRFLKEKNLPSETLYFDCFHFELTEKWANELLRLVLIGQKKATASSLYAFEKENLKLPEAGDYGRDLWFLKNLKWFIRKSNEKSMRL